MYPSRGYHGKAEQCNPEFLIQVVSRVQRTTAAQISPRPFVVWPASRCYQAVSAAAYAGQTIATWGHRAAAAGAGGPAPRNAEGPAGAGPVLIASVVPVAAAGANTRPALTCRGCGQPAAMSQLAQQVVHRLHPRLRDGRTARKASGGWRRERDSPKAQRVPSVSARLARTERALAPCGSRGRRCA